MEVLQSYHDNLLRQVPDRFTRFLNEEIRWNQRMVAIKGPRGAGKTTLMLQRIKDELQGEQDKTLYVTADHYWFYNHNLVETADRFYKNGGRYLFIDEVHKYPRWSRELKNIYDGFPDMQVVFSVSSALDIYRGEADLSRRVTTYELPGLSFREYLILTGHGRFESYSLEAILDDHRSAVQSIQTKLQHPLPVFHQYLQTGYLPIIDETPQAEIPGKIMQVINTVLEADLAFIQNYTPGTAYKVKKLLGVLAESAPFKPNIAALARKLEVSRDSIYTWLYMLGNARLLNLLHMAQKGTSFLQKPDKVYLENTNLAYALKSDPDTGTIRETFLLNQLKNAGCDVKKPKQADFLVNEFVVLEVGGKSKKAKQLESINNGYLVKDDIESGFGRTVPLWLFGFLY